MGSSVFYQGGSTEAVCCGAEYLRQQGICFSDAPSDLVTDLMLDIPSFSAPGILRSGKALGELLKQLPENVRIWGGNLPPSVIGQDLLQDPGYLQENAAITADCALRLCGLSLKTTWKDSRVLVIGWGRIGKCLCRLLRAMGSQVTVCARKESDRALLSAFGYGTIEPAELDGNGYQILFNTAPATVMTEDALGDCPLPMDLASKEGLAGKRVIRARGLPGIYAPVTSGKLIGSTILKKLGGDST